MPGEEEDVGSSALLAATSATQKKQQQQQQQQTQSASTTTNIATLQQQQQSQQPPPPPSLPPPPDYHQIIPTISVNPSSVPTSGNTSLGGSGSVGDILLHHASMDDDDDEDADDEDDICGSNSKLELELQFAGIDNENVELDVEDEDGLNGLPPPPGRRKVSSAHPGHPSSVRGGGSVSVDEEGGPVGSVVGGGVGEGGVEGDVEGGKVEPAEPHEPTCAEKCLFYTTAFFILLAVFSLFAFLFLVPFVIDPAFTTIFMKFNPEPAECYTVSRENHMGTGNCSWTSCREGCTREIFNCTQIMVNYLRPRRTILSSSSSTSSSGSGTMGPGSDPSGSWSPPAAAPSPITSVKSKTIHSNSNNKRNNNFYFTNTAASSSAYNSFYSSYSKSTHAHHDHDPGSSIPGVRWDTYPSASLNHILYQSTTTNSNNNNNNYYYINKNTNTNSNNNINKFSSSSSSLHNNNNHYQSVSYNNNNLIQEKGEEGEEEDDNDQRVRGGGVLVESTSSNNNNHNVIIMQPGDYSDQEPHPPAPPGSPQQSLRVSGGSRGGGGGRTSRAVLVPLLADMSDRNSVILNGNHKKKKHKVTPSSPNSNVLSVSNSEFNLPWASSLTAGGKKSGSPHQQQQQQGGGGSEGKWADNKDNWYHGARLFPNVKGCGYPPTINCSTFLRKYGQLGVNFSCYYSLVDPHLVVTTFDMDRVVMDLVYSMAIPIPSFIISVVYLIFAYFRIYNMDGSATPPPPATTNPHDTSTNNTNNNIGGSNSGGGGGGGSTGEPDGETSLSADDKTRILQRSTSRGLNALSDKIIPNSAKGVQPLIQMNDIASSHLPADADLILPRRNNRAPEKNGPTNPQAKNKGESESCSGRAYGGGDDDDGCPKNDVDVREKYLEPGVLPDKRKDNPLPPIEFSQLPKKS